MEVTYYVNNIEVNPPLNDEELSIELNFDKGNPDNQSVSLNELEWGLGDQTVGNDAADIINQWRLDGVSGGVGATEGIPYRLEITDEGTTYNVFDGYLDLSTAIWDCDRVSVTAVETGGNDWFLSVADSKSYAYIDEVEGLIPSSYTVRLPYVLSSVPDNQEAFLVTISMTFVVITLVGEIESLITLAKGYIANPTDWGKLAMLVLQLVYVVSLIISLVKLIADLIDLVIQPVKYHSCMSWLNNAKVGAASFGYTFKSSILETGGVYSNSYILPEKDNVGRTSFNDDKKVFGRTNSNDVDKGYFKGTVGDFYRLMITKFNGKLIYEEGNVLRFEREDYTTSAYNYILPPVDQTSYRLNHDELISNYVVSYQTDTNDKNTLQNYYGTETQVITQQKSGYNQRVNIEGLIKRNISLARGTRKNDFTYVENIVKSYLNFISAQVNVYEAAINAIIFSVNIIANSFLFAIKTLASLLRIPFDVPKIKVGKLPYSDLSSSIRDRKGMLLMENDFVSVPKDLILSVNTTSDRSTNIAITNESKNNSLTLYKDFHAINSFLPTSLKPTGNQYEIHEVEGVPFCFDDYQLVKDSNYMKDDIGRDGEILSLNWNVRKLTASANYKVKQLWTNNLKENKITPDGS